MSAAVITSIYPVPRGASGIERASIRMAEVMARWATRRAERRADRHEAMLASIKDEQTRPADSRAADHLLAQMGLMRR